MENLFKKWFTVVALGLRPPNGLEVEGGRSQIVARKNPALAVYAKSNSIFFVVGSSFAIRKLRTCPGRTPSGLDGPSAAPPFQRACSMELSDDKSGFDSTGVSFSDLAR